MNRKTILTVIIVVIVVGILAFFKIYSSSQKSQATPQKQGAGAVMAQAIVLHDTTLSYDLQTLGTIRANESVEIVSELSRKIISVNFQEGKNVSRGELLFQLDNADLLAQQKKLQSEKKLAEEDESRNNQLLLKGGISQQAYDESKNKLESVEADLDVLNVQLSKTEIRAPFSGKIGLRRVSEGAFVSANTVLTMLQDVSKVKIDFTLPEKYSALIKTGMSVPFAIENNSQKFEATISAVESSIDENTKTLTVRAVTNNPGGVLIPGSSAKISFHLQSLSNTIMVPTSALIPKFSGYQAYILKNGKATLKHITPGLRTESLIQVLDGLSAGDSLLTTNVLMLRPDVPVKVISKEY